MRANEWKNDETTLLLTKAKTRTIQGTLWKIRNTVSIIYRQWIGPSSNSFRWLNSTSMLQKWPWKTTTNTKFVTPLSSFLSKVLIVSRISFEPYVNLDGKSKKLSSEIISVRRTSSGRNCASTKIDRQTTRGQPGDPRPKRIQRARRKLGSRNRPIV